MRNAECGTAAVCDRCMMFASQVMLQTSLQVMFVLRTSDVLALPKLWWRSGLSHCKDFSTRNDFMNEKIEMRNEK